MATQANDGTAYNQSGSVRDVMIKAPLFAAAIAVFALSYTTNAHSADSCGWFAFAAATKSYNSAQNQANRFGGNVWSVDHSNSPNAGKGFWTVAMGPGSKSQANNWKRTYRARGAKGAYIGNRCFYGE